MLEIIMPAELIHRLQVQTNTYSNCMDEDHQWDKTTQGVMTVTRRDWGLLLKESTEEDVSAMRTS